MTGRVEPSNFDWSQAKEAVRDLKVWVFMVMGAAIYICKLSPKTPSLSLSHTHTRFSSEGREERVLTENCASE